MPIRFLSALACGAIFTLVATGCATTASETAVTETESVDSTASSLRWRTGNPKVVVDWDALVFQLDATGGVTRSLALVHLAQFDAVNSISGRYKAYLTSEAAPAGANADAAAVAAAARILGLRYTTPTAVTAINTLRTSSLAAIPDGQGKDDGIALGETVAQALWNARLTDKYNLPNPATYAAGTDPDDYQLTPPNFLNPVNQLAGQWVPFALQSASQFRPEPPPALSSRKFERDFDEVKTVGGPCPDPNVCARTPAQTEVAQFFVEQSHPAFFRLARTIVTNEQLSIEDATRFFAHLSLAMVDGVQSVFEAKYTYNFVRPVTAIRNAASDGNPDTVADPTWLPGLTTTPQHPEYPAGHPWISNSMLSVFKAYFGPHYPVALTSTTKPGVTLNFSSWKDISDTIEDARVWAGFHYRNTDEVSSRQGKKVGKYVLDNYLGKSRGNDDCDD